MSQPARVQRRTVITIELSDQDYEQLSKRAKEAGFSSVEQYIASILTSPPQAAAAAQAPEIDERLQRRLERAIQDLLNPFTQKVDDIAKRLAAIEEAIEELRQQPPQARPSAQAERPAARQQAAQQEREQPQGSRAIERLRRQGVVFEEEMSWLKAPDRFFAKLEREGAVVLELSDGKAAVDPEFWKRLLAELDATSLRDPKQVADKIAASLGDRGAQLFTKMVKSGVAIYDEDEKKWKVKVSAVGREGGGPEAQDEEEDEDYDRY